ncbi:MAG: hypothetical protein NT047_07640 [Deltaproteobacteria bacterium]|nr:hypothetical protein [Deltaproteobacteria bacterium]MCX5855803.1 hypothetical protein [Deltaproteobacteria bacterium]
MNSNLSDLKAETLRFFCLHWNRESIGNTPPEWSEPYTFVGPVPNHEKQGVYALLASNDVCYIGVGASRNYGKYAGHGLGARLNKYLRVREGKRNIRDSERPYQLINQWKEKGIDQIFTLGFEKEQSYLSYALEVFLIIRFPHLHNIIKPGQ